MNQQYTVELEEAREIVKTLKQAYKDHIGSRGLTKRYKIKDREMEFADAADVLKQLRFWQNEVQRLETAAGERPSRPRRIISRF
ncbi:putative phage associated protein [Neisseria animaloris]|uniref:hypothetical protein n=1 Tax=Neisseria animaloris TaxID=326522 RepID=UPI000A1959DD|nr:hypothetical protein [Neisseria animaloris]OSI06818.1 hypothetical protein BWD08_10680 [Neisseria animaloris]VEH86554.1 putative phage associated protein [Neisseria animaloris]